jgi:hypothetical protein
MSWMEAVEKDTAYETYERVYYRLHNGEPKKSVNGVVNCNYFKKLKI